ncbi:hypothetical protein FO519_008851 [Halicephalobus sp. NKZ332]|nr:hypothetical protein FO519_008851 [Halicephalobus sp. NKZ332]
MEVASASTTTRKKHLHQVHKIEASTPDLTQKKFKMNFFPQASGSNELNEKIVEFVAEFGVPFHAVEAHSFTNLMQLSNKNIKLPSRHEISKEWVPLTAAKIRSRKKNVTEDQYISLSFDEYSNNGRRFLSAVCMWINENWNKETLRLSVVPLMQRATADYLTELMTSELQKINYSDVVAVTRDGGTSVRKTCNQLGYPST